MTGQELFLKHAVQYLNRYRGNLAFVVEAINKGQIPNSTDETIKHHFESLKRHLRVDGESPEESFLLRFGLIVSGLIRGLEPPLMALKPERGGFSDRRHEEAAGQIQQLRAALGFGRRIFPDLSPETAAALKELYEYTEEVAPLDNAWVKWHSNLTEAEARAMAHRAFAVLDHPQMPEDLGTDILTCLADFREEGLAEQVAEVLRRELLSPWSLYRNAPDDIAKQLVERINDGEDHLLPALAWTRGRPARDAYQKWKASPPPWCRSLAMPIEGYTIEAGWGFDSNGQAKELISLSCYPLIPQTGSADAEQVVPCRTPFKEQCPSCKGPLSWLFDFTHLPADFFSGERSNAPKRVLCCLNCACFGPGIFSRYDPDGTAAWHPATASKQTKNYGLYRATVREVAPELRSAFAATQAFGLDDASSVGGMPMWIQDPQFPRCPDCKNVMTFLAQFDNSSMPTPEEGIHYAFYCGDCRVAAVNYQQT